MPRRFVIQFHDAPSGAHYDLMLEDGAALATWRLASMPAGDGSRGPMEARKLADHRLAYLSYQGPVSGGRGAVRIVESGTWVALERGESLWRVELAGESVRGRYVLRRVSGQHWELIGPERPARSGASGGPQ
jgi:hypothetical protein